MSTSQPRPRCDGRARCAAGSAAPGGCGACSPVAVEEVTPPVGPGAAGEAPRALGTGGACGGPGVLPERVPRAPGAGACGVVVDGPATPPGLALGATGGAVT